MGVFDQVYGTVRKIPLGQVTTYGEIAKHLGLKDARVIGWALHANKNPQIPCHRVVNKEGRLARNYAFGGWKKQKEKLLEEGISFKSESNVDLNLCRQT